MLEETTSCASLKNNLLEVAFKYNRKMLLVGIYTYIEQIL